MSGEPTPGTLGESSGVICEHCGEAEYRRILGTREDWEDREQFSCPDCGDGTYLTPEEVDKDEF